MALARVITGAIDWFYFAPFTKLMPRQTFRYAACGALNYIVLDPLLYAIIYNFILKQQILDLGVVAISAHVASLVFVFPITFFNGFWLNRNVAFVGSPLTQGLQLVRYSLTIVGSIVLSYLLLKLFVEVCGIWATPSKLLTTLCTTVYSYVASKYFAFRNSQKNGQ